MDYRAHLLLQHFSLSQWVMLTLLTPSRRTIIVRLVTSFFLAAILLCGLSWVLVAPVGAAGITVWKTVSSSTVKAGEPFTYTINALNTTGNQINLLITDPVPPGATIANTGGGVLVNGVMQWTVLAVDHGATAKVSFSVVVNQAGSVVNADYRASSNPNFGIGDPVTTNVIPNNPAVVTITPNPAATTAGSSSDLTITVHDAYGNPVADGTAVTINFDKGVIDGQSAGTPINATTSGGQIVKTLSGGSVAGTARITATAGSVQGTTSVVFNAGSPAVLTVEASPNSITANGSATALITVTVQDSYGNPVTQTPVTITTSLGNLNWGGSTLVINTNNGKVVTNLSSTTAGTANLTVAVGSLIDTSKNVRLTPGVPHHLSLLANPTSITADGISNSTVTLQVLDQYNNLVDTAVPVNITTSMGKLNGGGATYAETITDGDLQVLLTSGTLAGTAHITATASGLNTSTLVNFTPGPPAQINLSVTPTSIPADGTTTTALTAIVRDAFGNAVNTPVNVTFAATSGTLLPDNAGTTINGVITRSLRSSTDLGTVSITATAAGISTPATNSVNFVVGPPHTVDVTLSPISPITVGVPVNMTLTVRDSIGHVVPGVTITVTSALGSISPSVSGTTDGAGQIQRTLISTRAGLDILGVSNAQGVLSVNGASVTFVPDVPVQAALIANPTQLYANGSTTAVITATIKDRYGNAVSGIVPNFTTTLGTLSGNGSTDSSGITTRILQSSTTLGTATVSVTGLTTVTNATVAFVTGPPAIAVLQAQPITVTANGSDVVTLVLTTTDSVGHPIVGQNLAVTSSIGTIAGSGATTAQGVLTRTLTSTKSGQPQIYIGGIEATGDIITFLAGPLDQIKLTPYGSLSTPVPASAGAGLAFSATGYDIYENPISGLPFVWTKVSQGGDGTINGNGLFTGTIAGKVQIKATVGAKFGASFVNVGPGPAVMANIDADTTTLPANGSSSASLTFYVRDIYGNLVGTGIPLTVISSIGTVEGNSTTDINGVVNRTIHSTQAGQAVISVTNLTTITGKNVITFTPGTPNRAIVSASPTSLPANGVATSTIVITLLDNFGNAVGAGYTPLIQVSSGTISGSSSTDSNGIVTRTLTAPLGEGSASFTVKYGSIPLSVSGDTVSFVVGPLDRVMVSPSGLLDIMAGQPVTFTVQAYDKFNAPIATGVTYGWNLEFTGPGFGTQNTIYGPQVIFTGATAGTGVKLTGWAEKGSPYAEATVDITVLPGVPASGILAVTPVTIPADGVSPITFTLTNLVDAYGNTAAENSVVTVTLQSAPIIRTNTGLVSGGEANIFVAATTQAGTYPFSVTSAFGPLSLMGPTNVTFVPGPPTQAAIVSATPAALVADGVSTMTLVLQLRDAFGNKVAAGLTPVVTTTLGTILPGGGATDSNGVITRTLQAGLVVGQPLVSINGFAASGSTISFIPGPPVMAYITVITSTLATGGNSTPVTFDVRDAWDHPVADATLITPTLTPAYGVFSGLRQTIGGIVNQILTSGSSVGSATIGSAGLTVNGDTVVNFIAGPAAIALVDAASTSLIVGNTTTLTITVTDAYSNVVPPTLITTTAILGVLDGGGSTLAKTTASNSAIITASLSSTSAGTETLTLAGPNGPLALHPSSDTIQFLPSVPMVVTLNPLGPLTATAGVTLTVTASSRDQYGNAVDLWTPVNYTWWQSATVSNPGYGILMAADPHARAVNFKPIKVGSNRLWATGGVTTSNILNLNVVAGAPTAATSAISPTSVLANGTSLYTVTLTGITDAFGNAVPDGTPLTVTIKSIPPVVGTGTLSAGIMTLALPASVDAGTHIVEVSGSGGVLTLQGQKTMTFTPGLPVRAFIDATPETLPADGVSTATIAVSVYDDHFNLVGDGLPITVTASSGTLTGSGTTINGQVTRILQAPLSLGIATFSVETPDGPLFASGDSVVFVPGAPAQALVTAVPAKVLADGVSTSQITITIKDGYGFTVPGNGAAQLSVVRGSLMPTTTVASAGSFTATFKANTSTGLAGLAVVYNGTSLPTVGDTLELIPGAPVSATISATPKSLAAGTSQQSTLTVSLSDAWGRPVVDGTVVTVTTSLGSILSNTSTTTAGLVTRVLTPGLTIGTATFTVTTSSGSISPAGDKVSITAGALDHVVVLPTTTVQVMAGSAITFSAKGYDVFGNETGTGLFNWKLWPSGGNGTLSSNGVFTGTVVGLVGLQASQGTVYSPIKDVTILPGTAITALVSASPITIPVGGATTVLTITVKDAFGNLVANGTTLNVTSNLGTLSGSATTQNGILTRTLTSGIYPGQASIMVNGWEAGGDKVTFMPKSWMVANPPSLYADGVSETVLTIDVFDASGAPAPDGTIPTVTTSLGTLSGSGGTVNGRLTRILRASLIPGVSTIFVNGFQAQGSVPFIVGPPAVARISANPPWLMANGTSHSTLTIIVQDAYGHVITNTDPLTVTTSRGTISGFAPTVSGVTTRILTASTQSGAAIISVAGLTPAGDTKIHFVGNQLHDVGFESGNLDSWTVGQVVTPTGSTPAYSATVLNSDVIGGIVIIPPSGQTMARLGATTADNTIGHRLSESWLSQPVYITPGGLTQLTFWYRLLSFDVAVGSPNNNYKEWDPFEVYVNGREVLQDGYVWSQDWENWHRSSPTTPKDMGWKQGVLDLSPYVGQVVTLEFRVPNRQGPIDNTWVYMDGFNLAYRQIPVYRTFIPIVLK